MSRGVLQVFVARLEACSRSFEVSFQSTPNAVYTDNNRFWSAVFELGFLCFWVYTYPIFGWQYAVGVENHEIIPNGDCHISNVKLLLLCCNIQTVVNAQQTMYPFVFMRCNKNLRIEWTIFQRQNNEKIICSINVPLIWGKENSNIGWNIIS